MVVFDIGGVLADVDVRRARARWASHGYPPSRFHAAFVGSGVKARGDRGELDAEGMRLAAEEAVGHRIPADVLLEVWGSMVRWHAWTPALLARLGVPYGVLSTIDPVHAAALGPLPGADPVVYSFDVGAVKPDRRAFEALVERSGRDAARLRYVDDRPENVEAAARLGLQARHVNGLPELERALADVLDLGPS